MADEIQIEGGGQLITVSQQLRESNLAQGELMDASTSRLNMMNNPALELLSAINFGITQLNTNFLKFLDQAELDRLKMLEQQRESVGPTTPDVEAPEKEDKSFFQKIKEWIENFKENFLLYLTSGLTALTLSNFGFTGFEVKILKDIKERFAKVGTRISTFFSGVATKISEFFKPVKEFFTKFLPDPEKSSKALTKLRELFKPVSDMLGKFTGALSRFGGLVMRVLRPLALGMAAFDGFRNAQAEYEESGNMLTTVGNFLTGFVGSFIGEFINLIRDMITGAIRWIFPESTKDGTFLNEVLSGLEEMNFATMIVDGWNMIFDMIAGAIDAVKAWFTETYESIKNTVLEAADALGIGVDPEEMRRRRIQRSLDQEQATLTRLEEEGGTEQQIAAARERVIFRQQQLAEIGREEPEIVDDEETGLEEPEIVYDEETGLAIDKEQNVIDVSTGNPRQLSSSDTIEQSQTEQLTERRNPNRTIERLNRREAMYGRGGLAVDRAGNPVAIERTSELKTNTEVLEQQKSEQQQQTIIPSSGGTTNVDNSSVNTQAITMDTPSALDGLGLSYGQ